MLAKKVPNTDQFITLIKVLVEGLSDTQTLCSNGACVVLNSLVKQRGAELDTQVLNGVTYFYMLPLWCYLCGVTSMCYLYGVTSMCYLYGVTSMVVLWC